MDPAMAVLLAIIVCAIPIAYRAKTKLDDKIDGVKKESKGINDTVIEVKTKVDMMLDHMGFDLRKVNRAIQESMDEIKKNDKPSIGCINLNELYKDKKEV